MQAPKDPVPQLLLSAFRWLDCVSDPAALTSCFLEARAGPPGPFSTPRPPAPTPPSVHPPSLSPHSRRSLPNSLPQVLDACSEEVKKEVVSFIPEIAGETDHVDVVNALEDLLSTDCLVGPVLEALQNLDLNDALKQRVVQAAMRVVGTASMHDLPVVIRFLLQSASKCAPTAPRELTQSPLERLLRLLIYPAAL